MAEPAASCQISEKNAWLTRLRSLDQKVQGAFSVPFWYELFSALYHCLTPLLMVALVFTCQDFFEGEVSLRDFIHNVLLTCSFAFYISIQTMKRQRQELRVVLQLQQQRQQQETPQPEQARYQEYRARGHRAIAEGLPFQQERSRRFLEKGHWFRN